MRFFLYFLCALIILFTTGCVKNNPAPVWLEVHEWTLEENPDYVMPQGELTHNFTQAWVYVNNKIIGVFEVPFKIPVLEFGNSEIKIYPAIKNNGISDTKKIYPFVEPFVLNSELTSGETIVIDPTTRYYANTKFYIEDFEDAAIKFQPNINSATEIAAGNDPAILQAFNGNFYGFVELNNTTDTTWIQATDFESIQGADLPRKKEVYLEIDFYNTNSVVTGLLAIAPSGTKENQNIQLNAQNPSNVKWKKIYIDLMELVSNSDPQAYFEHTFQAEIAENEAQTFIILDNIKVVHF